MSARKKLRGGSQSQLTLLKERWIGWSEKQRDFWRAQFCGRDTQAVSRALLKKRTQIELTRDNQLTEFRQWLEEQDAMDREAERQQEEETRLQQLHPDWDADRLRTEVIAGSLRRAIATGDFKGLGLKAVRAGQNEQIIQLDEEKFKEGLRTKLESGLAQLAQHIKGNAKAQAAYEAFRSTIADSTK